MSLNSSWNRLRNDDFATGRSRSIFYAIFSVNRYAYCEWLSHEYEAHIKGLPICYREVQVKNDFADNNNKHLIVTAIEGACRNITERCENLKLCFLFILYETMHFQDWSMHMHRCKPVWIRAKLPNFNFPHLITLNRHSESNVLSKLIHKIYTFCVDSVR